MPAKVIGVKLGTQIYHTKTWNCTFADITLGVWQWFPYMVAVRTTLKAYNFCHCTFLQILFGAQKSIEKSVITWHLTNEVHLNVRYWHIISSAQLIMATSAFCWYAGSWFPTLAIPVCHVLVSCRWNYCSCRSSTPPPPPPPPTHTGWVCPQCRTATHPTCPLLIKDWKTLRVYSSQFPCMHICMLPYVCSSKLI